MCGIAGAIGTALPAEGQTQRALYRMRNRGPDARGLWQGALRNQQVCLLHSRLSIIDIDARSNQPFEQDDCVLVFNGEIYNYIELRAELERSGTQFRTNSDTEVIVHAWRRWGCDCFNRFEGMWAFALFDRRRDELILSRDPFGEKPLYYWCRNGTLYFGSEVKFLAALAGEWPQINKAQLARYLVNGYKSLYKNEQTWFEGVREIPAATFAVCINNEDPKPERYWTLNYRPDESMSAETAMQGVRERMFDAIRIRLRADVPLAFCLSGGIDSGTLACIAGLKFGAKVHAFSIVDSDPRYNESKNIAAVVDRLSCDLHVVEASTKDFFKRMNALIAYHDGPVVTTTYYMHSFISEAVADSGYRVAISGTAADELFTGYYDHYAFWLAEMSGCSDYPGLLNDWKNSYGRYVRNPLLQDPMHFVRHPDERGHIYLNANLFAEYLTAGEAELFEETVYSSNLLRNRMLNEIHHEAVPVILHEDDLNSMMFSVENRSPYLDRRLAEFLFTVPNRHLIHDGYAKWLLRAAGEGLLPDAVRLDKQKRGFNTSIDSLVDRKDSDTIDALLADGAIFDLVRRDRIEQFVRGDMTDNSLSKFLFSFISARLFLDQHANGHA